MRITTALAAALAAALLSACTAIPADPERSLETIRTTGVLRAGASPAEGEVEIDGDAVSGREAALVTAFAAAQGATVEWTVDGEEHLMGALEEGELDVVIGGLTAESPWTDKAALTRAYREDTDERGKKRKHVMAARLGENALVTELERFLDEEGGRG